MDENWKGATGASQRLTSDSLSALGVILENSPKTPSITLNVMDARPLEGDIN